MKFSKYHALGNDYLVVEHEQFRAVPMPEGAARICAAHFGIGADGILVHEPDTEDGRFQIRVLNPDGSEAEKSGNGLRIFARYLWDYGLVGQGPFPVVTAGGPVTCQVFQQGQIVSVDMGPVRFDSHEIPVAGPPREVLRETLEVGGERLEYSAASIGNPHCVIVRDAFSTEEVHRLGPLIETEPRFPNLTNVQFLRVMDRRNLWIEIWERGVGYTLASGTSSCAAAAVAHRLGLCEREVTAHMPGGRLKVQISEDYQARLTGPVVKVADGQLCDEVFQDQDHIGGPGL